MTAVSFYRQVLFRLGITFMLVIPLNGQQQSSPSSDIFLLDLGIVIKPATGEESYSRIINNTSDEVAIRIKQVHSGNIQAPLSKELLAAIERINTRIADMENSFHSELMALKSENVELKHMLTEIHSPVLNRPDLPDISIAKVEPYPLEDFRIVELPIVDSIIMFPPIPFVGFKNDIYYNGMFAYQCGNFASALKCFNKLDLQSAKLNQVENVLYWTADAYLQMHHYEDALIALDKLLKYSKSEMADDALVKKGILYKELGNMDLAVNTFKKIVVGHPDSEYTRLAALEIKRGEIVLQ